jgi:SAM-dependent methyltransferase
MGLFITRGKLPDKLNNPLKSLLFQKLIVRQFRRPSGLLGLYALNFMKKNNQDYIERVCGLIHPRDNDTILEIGCGAGDAIRRIAACNHCCAIDAIDFSPLMLRKARNAILQCTNSGRIRIVNGDFCTFDFNHATYSCIFAINVLYFWTDLIAVFSKIHALLKPNGRVILYMSGPERLNQRAFAATDVFNRYSLADVKTALSNAGFSTVTHETINKMGFATYYIHAKK